MVPQIEQRNLIAVFNGGFKAIHGRFGMMVSGVTLLPQFRVLLRLQFIVTDMFKLEFGDRI